MLLHTYSKTPSQYSRAELCCNLSLPCMDKCSASVYSNIPLQSTPWPVHDPFTNFAITTQKLYYYKKYLFVHIQKIVVKSRKLKVQLISKSSLKGNTTSLLVSTCRGHMRIIRQYSIQIYIIHHTAVYYSGLTDALYQ